MSKSSGFHIASGKVGGMIAKAPHQKGCDEDLVKPVAIPV